MITDSKKISTKQATFLFLTVVFSPAIGVVPIYAAQRAKSAAWLAAIPATALLIILILIWNSFCTRFQNHSLMDMFSEISGRVPGKIISFAYLVWIILLTALYVRYFSIRLTISTFPNTNSNLFSISILLVIAYTLRHGLTTLARFNEVVQPIVAITFFLLVLMLTPYVKPQFLMPVSYRSILPVFEASLGTVGILVYFSFLFIISDRINNKEVMKKVGIQASLFLLVAITTLLVITLGTFNYSIVQRTQLPFLIAVKQISLFNVLEKIESVVVAFWILTDFVLISFFIICALRIIQSLFSLQETTRLINIYIIFIFILSMYIANSVFEMQKLSEIFFIPGNILFGFVVPLVQFVIGKIRKII